MQPTLFMTIGYPGAGKSFFSRKLAQTINLVRLNSGISGHGIREFMFSDKLQGWPENNDEVYGALRYAMSEVLKAGHSVIFDASNSSKEDRAKLYAIANTRGARAIIIWLQTPLELARSRADTRDSHESAEIPRTHFNKLAQRLELPNETETYITIDGTLTFPEQLQSFRDQLEKLSAPSDQ